MRRCVLPLVWLFVPAVLAGQGVPKPGGWSFAIGADGMRFGGTARDTAVPAESAADLRPSGRAGLHLMLERSFGDWRVQLETGMAEGNAEVANHTVVVRDKTLELSRYRLAMGLERRVTALGRGELAVALAPTLDLWRASGESRVRLGGEFRAAVRVPLGRVVLENRLAAGISGPPLEDEDLGDGFELKRLRSVSYGVGLRVPL